MLKNQLHTPLDAMQFVIDFAQTSLADVAPADLTQIDEQVRMFTIGPALPTRTGDRYMRMWTGRLVVPLEHDELVRIQTDVFAMLRGLARDGHYQHVDVALSFILIRPKADGEREGYSREIGTMVSGNSPRDLFLYRVIRHLEELGMEKLSACRDCGRLFFKVTRKEFCSTRCQSRVYMQGRRAAERVERETITQKKKERRHGKTARTR